MRSTLDARQVLSHAFLIVACLAVLLPLGWIVRTSFVSQMQAYRIPPDLTAPPSIENYVTVFQGRDFGRHLSTTLIVCGISASLAVALGGLGAYGVARRERGGTGITLAMLSGQLFPRIALVLPLYILVRNVGGYDTVWVFILTYLSFMVPATVVILIPYFRQVPKEVEDAALVDGAGRLRILARIVFPLALPGVAAAWVFALMLGWNELLFPLFLGGRSTRMLTVAVGSFVTQRGVAIGPVAAATMLCIVPVVFVVILLRRALVGGLTAGSVR